MDLNNSFWVRSGEKANLNQHTPQRISSESENGEASSSSSYNLEMRSSIDLNNWSGRHATHDINAVYPVIQTFKDCKNQIVIIFVVGMMLIQ